MTEKDYTVNFRDQQLAIVEIIQAADFENGREYYSSARDFLYLAEEAVSKMDNLLSNLFKAQAYKEIAAVWRKLEVNTTRGEELEAEESVNRCIDKVEEYLRAMLFLPKTSTDVQVHSTD